MLKEREEFYVYLIKNSNSLIEVCRKANIVPTTGNYDTLKRVIRDNQIDISHFKRMGNGATLKKETSEYLIKGSNISSFRLKNKLLKEGYKEYRCEKCENTEWYGKPIPLELHHINGDNTDNRLENLQILCPNCHAFTDTYSGKNQKLNIKKKEIKESNNRRQINAHKRTLDEDKKNEIIIQSFECDSVKKIAKKTKHTERTIKKILQENNITINKLKQIKEENDKKIPLILESLKRTRSYSGTAREFGVTDNAIKKILVRRGYPKHIKQLLEVIE